jgi:hypothetical protein
MSGLLLEQARWDGMRVGVDGHHRRCGEQPADRRGFRPASCSGRQAESKSLASWVHFQHRAALATYLLGAYKLELFNQLGIALVSGIGGGNVLTSLMQKQQSNVLKAQMEALEEALRNAMTPPKE